MSISLFGSSSLPPAWKQMEDWHARQKQYTAELESSTSDLMSAIVGSASSTTEGMMEIIMNKAVAAARQHVNLRARQSGLDISV